jgi:hypothetical protein
MIIISIIITNIVIIIIPWSRILPEKLTGPQVVKKFPPHFMEHEGSLPYSQQPSTSP